MASMAEKILPLPDETHVLPGHGGTTTIGWERKTNPFLVELAVLSGGSGGAMRRRVREHRLSSAASRAGRSAAAAGSDNVDSARGGT